jgi:hypothetical protein
MSLIFRSSLVSDVAGGMFPKFFPQTFALPNYVNVLLGLIRVIDFSPGRR